MGKSCPSDKIYRSEGDWVEAYSGVRAAQDRVNISLLAPLQKNTLEP